MQLDEMCENDSMMQFGNIIDVIIDYHNCKNYSKTDSLMLLTKIWYSNCQNHKYYQKVCSKHIENMLNRIITNHHVQNKYINTSKNLD